MFIAIVQHTPVWVWALLAALVVVGLSQTREREMSLARVTILPLVMLALSLSGVLSAFGHVAVALGAWAGAVGVALAFGRRFIAVRGTTWSPRAGTLHVPGSWLPLALILGLFALKYFAGASLALHPGLASDASFAAPIGLAYGAFSGLFLARGLSLRQLAQRPAAALAA